MRDLGLITGSGKQNKNSGLGEMAQLLKVLAALPEDSNLLRLIFLLQTKLSGKCHM